MFFLFSKIPSITTDNYQVKQNKDSVLLDVRTPAEYRAGHIAQARNLPLNKIDTYKGSLKQPIYIICQSGMRSKKAARNLKKRGYHVTNIAGGMNAWNGKIRGGK